MKYLLYIGIVLGAIMLILALRAGLVYWSVGKYQKYWQENNQSQKDPQAISVIALGDSAAQGVGASSAQKSYVGQVSSNIEQKTSKKVQITNLSVSGAKIADVTAQQIPELQKLHMSGKTIVVLDIGTNDVTRGSYDEEFARDIDALFSKLPKQTIVADLPYLGKSRWQSIDPYIISANKILHEKAEKYGLEVVPLYDNLKAKNGWRVYSGDFFHPSDYGYSIWADTFWQAVNKQT